MFIDFKDGRKLLDFLEGFIGILLLKECGFIRVYVLNNVNRVL